MLNTPVVFIIFNRPDLTQIVFNAIRQAQPKRLLIVADGPRFPEEAQKCEQTRCIINQVDWDCQVLTNFSDTNLGCRKRVSSGLDWVFSEVEQAIILEDDCLPSQSFFYFCQELLDYYKNDTRIMHISGDNFQKEQKRTNYSYYFSKYNHNWGWASWRRAWKYYDLEMKTWTEFKEANVIKNICDSIDEQKYWLNIFEQNYKGTINTWDYQWTYACWSQGGLSILPNYNLVSNIGFRSDATHTLKESPFAQLPTKDIWEIKHPPFVIRDKLCDYYTFERNFGEINQSLYSKVKGFILSFIKYLSNS